MLIGALHCWENFQLNFNRFLLLSSVPLNTLVVTVFWIFSRALLVTPLHLVKTLFEVSGVDITLPILQPGWPYQWGGSPKHIFLTSWKINFVWISQSALDISRKKKHSRAKRFNIHLQYSTLVSLGAKFLPRRSEFKLVILWSEEVKLLWNWN